MREYNYLLSGGTTIPRNCQTIIAIRNEVASRCGVEKEKTKFLPLAIGNHSFEVTDKHHLIDCA
jgi:hypothetical protein